MTELLKARIGFENYFNIYILTLVCFFNFLFIEKIVTAQRLIAIMSNLYIYCMVSIRGNLTPQINFDGTVYSLLFGLEQLR